MADGKRWCRVVLMGMMGSGKTTIGRLLAHRTGWPYHDNDALLQRLEGETARSLLAEDGVTGLRSGEADALRLGLKMPAPCLVGAPAGTILDPGIRAQLAEKAIVVWLTASPETLAARGAGAVHRPWLDDDAIGWMTETLAARTPLYEEVADVVVSGEDGTPQQLADEIVAWLAERCGSDVIADR